MSGNRQGGIVPGPIRSFSRPPVPRGRGSMFSNSAAAWGSHRCASRRGCEGLASDRAWSGRSRLTRVLRERNAEEARCGPDRRGGRSSPRLPASLRGRVLRPRHRQSALLPRPMPRRTVAEDPGTGCRLPRGHAPRASGSTRCGGAAEAPGLADDDPVAPTVCRDPCRRDRRLRIGFGPAAAGAGAGRPAGRILLRARKGGRAPFRTSRRHLVVHDGERRTCEDGDSYTAGNQRHSATMPFGRSPLAE
jgi:hypothetical protein